MAINFPDTPQVGETHTESGRQWEWNGTSWRIIGNASNYTLPIASDVTLGGIKVGSNLTINALTGVLDAPPPSGYTLPVATTTQLGGVKIDGNTIIIDGNGVISGQAAYTLPVATTNVLGGVKIDGTSITINNGVISAAATGGANVTTDDTPPTIASDGDLWWDSVAGNLKVYYEDVDSSQWVDASSGGAGQVGTLQEVTDLGNSTTNNITANRVSDTGGNVRSLPVNTQGAAYTLVSSDIGKMIKASGDITIASNNVFQEGECVTIYNSSAGDINLTRSGTNLYLVGDNTNQDRVLAQKGIATIVCVGSNEYVVMGGGIT